MANPTKHHGHGASDEHEHGVGENAHVSYERRDVNVIQITSFGIGLLVAFMVSVAAMWVLFQWFAKREDKLNPANPPSMMTQRQTLPPEPRLQSEPTVELKQMRDNEEMLLMSYGWVSADKVHIPIDKAIEIVAAKGLPSRVSPQGADHDGFRTIPSDASGGKTLEKISQ